MKTRQTNAFALPDLISSVTIVALLALVGLPLLADQRGATDGLRCVGNMRQLILAWQMYANENEERLVENLHGGEATLGAAANTLRRPWALGWMGWGLETDNTNLLLLRNVRYAKLGPYISAEGNIHKCPADGNLSPLQRARGVRARVRSVVMNMTLGHASFPVSAGPWDPIYRPVLKVNDMRFPTPGETSVFFEEHPDSINDPAFFPPQRTTWIDLPGGLHDGAGGFSYADGHADLHAWRGSARKVPVRFGSMIPRARLNDPDVHWLSYHSQRVSQASF